MDDEKFEELGLALIAASETHLRLSNRAATLRVIGTQAEHLDASWDADEARRALEIAQLALENYRNGRP